MIKVFDVECPYTGQLQRISVDYCEIPVCGTLQKSYKKMSFECSLSGECPTDLKDRYGCCSAYANLPITIHS